MSKKKKTTINFKLKHPRELGKFYSAYDSSGGHPVMVYFVNPIEDVYYIQRFSTKPRKDRILLLHSIDPTSNKSQWLVKRPEAVRYDDIVYTDKYKDFRVHKDDEANVKKYQKFNLINKKMDARCESPEGVSKHMTSSTGDIKSKTKKKRK